MVLAAGTTAYADTGALITQTRMLPLPAAQEAVQTAINQGALTAQERHFLAAILLGRSGQLSAAETQLRELLDDTPSLDLVRYELVQILAAQRKFAAARFHLSKLNRPGIATDIRKSYQALDKKLQAAKPWHFSFGLSVEPTNNINRATEKQTVEILGLPFDVDDATAAKSGVRTNIRLGAERRMTLNDKTVSGVGVFVSRVGFGSIDEENLELGLNAFVASQVSQNLHVRGNFSAVRSFVGRAPAANAATGSLAFAFPIANTVQQTVQIGRTHLDFVNPSLNDGTSDYVSTVLRFQPTAARAFRIGASVSDSNALLPKDQFTSWSVSAGISQILPRGLLLDVDLNVGQRDYKGPNPLTGQRQSDDFAVLEGSVTLGQTQVWGFSPKISVRYEQTDSSFDARSFDALSTGITFTRSF